jgi:hypothetical protein
MSGEAGERSQPKQRSRWPKPALAGALLLGAAGNLADGFNEDELQHLHAAWLVGQGLVPYRDYFDHHPPLYHLVVSPVASALGANYAGLFLITRLFGLLIAAGTAILFSKLVSRTAGSAVAWLAAALLVVSRPSDILFYFRPDSMAMLLTLAGMLLLLKPDRSTRNGLAAGALVGAAAMNA